MNSLRVENVSRSFGGVRALDDVSFFVEPGTIHGLIGPNGAGKTTLINILSGLLPPSAGRMSYKDHDLHRLAVHQMAAIGIARTFQNIRLFPHMSCLENVQAGQHLTSRRSLLPRLLRLPSARHEDRSLYKQAIQTLARVGLDDKADYQSRNLSYGERRRLEIARALSLNPSLLLLDEPVAGMRQGEATVVADLLRDMSTSRVSAAGFLSRCRHGGDHARTRGPANLVSVQIAATAMAPAPMNLTLWNQMAVTKSSSEPACEGSSAVRIGTATAQAINSPSSIAMPTERPTRYPAPRSASENDMS